MTMFRKTFKAVYDQYKEYNGLRMDYVAVVDPSTYDAKETDTMYIVRVHPEDGPSVLIEAWPEEVVDTYEPLKHNVKRWGEYFANMTEEQFDNLNQDLLTRLDMDLEGLGDMVLVAQFKVGQRVLVTETGNDSESVDEVPPVGVMVASSARTAPPTVPSAAVIVLLNVTEPESDTVPEVHFTCPAPETEVPAT